MYNVLVTGAAGFIGYHVTRRLLERGDRVVGVDNLNEYYDVKLKEARLAQIKDHPKFTFIKADIVDAKAMAEVFETLHYDIVVHLAAQAGVRYSLENPMAYINTNIVGFANILEECRKWVTPHLVYASSSSVYGANKTFPFSEKQNVDHPVSLYAATKKSNELIAHSYSSIYGMPTTGLRFFTVYGPWGRPDMALFMFTKALLAREPINVFNHGDMRRDFTYIDDIVDGVLKVMSKLPMENDDWDGENPVPGTSYAPYRIYNIGNNNPVNLERMIEVLEEHLCMKADKKYLPMQPGDVKATAADISAIANDLKYVPKTTIEEGIPKFVEWFRRYYRV